MAAKMAEAHFNTSEHRIFDQHIFCLAGDGCLQEGVSAEASAFAGHFGLDNLILIYDSNAITLDAMAKQTQSEDTRKRYEAYGFNTQEIQGDDMQEFLDACNIAKERDNGKPQFIITIPSRGKEFRKLRERRRPMAKPAPSMLMPREKDLASRTSDTLFQKRRANISPNIKRNCSRILPVGKDVGRVARKKPGESARLRRRYR